LNFTKSEFLFGFIVTLLIQILFIAIGNAFGRLRQPKTLTRANTSIFIKPTQEIFVRNKRLCLLLLTAVSIVASLVTSSSASIVVTFTDTGGSVNLTVNGSFTNLGTLPSITTTSVSPSASRFGINAGFANETLLFSAPAASPAAIQGVSLTSIGTLPAPSNFNLLADPTVNVGFSQSFFGNTIYLPNGYAYGDNINVAVNGVANSLGDLGLADGDSWGVSFSDGAGGTQSLTFVAGLNSVPEPGSMTLFGIGVAGLGFIRRRKSSN